MKAVKLIVNWLIEIIFFLLGASLLISNIAAPTHIKTKVVAGLIGFLFITCALAGFLSAPHFDKVLTKNESNFIGFINISILPDKMVTRMSIFRGISYCASLFQKSLRFRPLMLFQRNYINNKKFIEAARPIDYILGWLLAINIAIFTLFGLVLALF